MNREIKVVFDNYSAEFYKRCGRGWRTRPFYTCGNAGVGDEFARALKMIGHRVTFVSLEQDDL